MRYTSLFALALGLAVASCGQKTESGAENGANQPAVAPEAADTTQTNAAADGAEAAPVMVGDMMSFGDKISPEGAVAIAELPKLMDGKDSVQVKLTANVASVCQVKGCWMELPLTDKEKMRVRFKEYAFFVPKDATGKTTVVEGWAKKYTTSVEELRHYAEDAGKTKEEIAAITKPETGLAFEANGVLLK
jgi:hypothetical protein